MKALSFAGVGMPLAVVAVLRAGASPAPTPAGDSTVIHFPRDHGSHPDAAIEWWYTTGHLSGERGNYGFQLTFFRVGDVHFAHFAISDLKKRRFLYDERMHLALPGMAGSSETGLDVFVEDWSDREENGRHHLRARTKDAAIDLALTPLKPPVLQGEQGLSRKGPGENEYSHYVSITRLSASGTLTLDGGSQRVSGTAWFDHEWGPGALPAGAAGWDWFALQLSDGSEAMLFRMRLKDGRASPYSAGTYVPPGTSPAPVPIAWKDVELVPRTHWTSEKSKASYPALWSVSIRSIGLEATVSPLLADQELSTTRSTGVTYWEGACDVRGTKNGAPVTGRAYVEMTGYAGRDVPGFEKTP